MRLELELGLTEKRGVPSALYYAAEMHLHRRPRRRA